MRRRHFLSYALATAFDYGLTMSTPLPASYASASGGKATGRRTYAPSWAPRSGELKTISYIAGAHPAGAHGGAVLSEISPSYQSWNPLAPAAGPYGGVSGNYFFSSIQSYGGAAFNTETRQIIGYGGGHSAFNVPAPFAFDLRDLTWKWLDTPLPIDGLDLIRANRVPVPPTQANLEIYYPPEQYNYNWNEWNGNWSGWPSGFGRAGKIQPNTGHSRARLIHIPGTGYGNLNGALFWNGAGGGILGGINGMCSHLFNHDTRTWERSENQYLRHSSGSGSIYDPVSNKVIVVGEAGATTRLGVFDVARRTWTERNARNSIVANTDNGSVVLHESVGLCIVPFAKNSLGAVAYYDGITFGAYACPVADIVGMGAFSWTALIVTGTSWPLNNSGNNNFIGWSYCPADGCLYTVNGVNGSRKYWKMTPPKSDFLGGAWTVTEHTFTSGTLASPGQTSMVFNKLKWDAISRAFIWFGQSISSPVQAFRPEGL